MIRKEDLFRIGQFSKPHGVKGELTLLTDYDPEKIKSPYLVCEMDGIAVPFFTESYRPKGSASVLVKMENVDDETAAHHFAGRAVYYPLSAMDDRAPENTGWTNLIGYVLESQDRGELGIITDVDETTVNILLQVDYRGKELLIPVAEEWIDSINPAAKKLTMSLPEGLIDL
jgi:16S rRNA processing protein RimM